MAELELEYDAYVRLILQLDELVAGFQRHPDPSTAERAAALLSGIDALHREGLTRFVHALREAGAGDLVDEVAEDPVVRTFLGLYDLADLELPEPRSTGQAQGFVPIEELGVGPPPDRAAGPHPAPTRPPDDAEWLLVARAHEIPAGHMRTVVAHGRRVLILNVLGDFRAYRDACPGTELPLEFGRLEGAELHCPWHGCRFDAQTGRRIDRGGNPLDRLPIRVHEGAVRVVAPAGGPSEGTGCEDEVRLIDLVRNGAGAE